MFPSISAIANFGNTVLGTLWDVNVWLLIALFTALALLVFYVIDRTNVQRKDKLNKPQA